MGSVHLVSSWGIYYRAIQNLLSVSILSTGSEFEYKKSVLPFPEHQFVFLTKDIRGEREYT
jgi:hypothetical protein